MKIRSFAGSMAALGVMMASCAAPNSPSRSSRQETQGPIAQATPQLPAGGTDAPAATAEPTLAASASTAPKMTAPVTLALTQRPTGAAGVYDMSLTATLTADVDDISLRLDKKSQAFGPRVKGEVLTLSDTVTVAKGEGVDAIGSARVMLGGRTLAAAVSERVGEPVKEPAGRVVDVPGVGPVKGTKN